MPFTQSTPGALDKLINRGTSKTGLPREMLCQVPTYKTQLHNFTFFLPYSKADIIFRSQNHPHDAFLKWHLFHTKNHIDRYWLNSWNFYIAGTASDTVSM